MARASRQASTWHGDVTHLVRVGAHPIETEAPDFVAWAQCQQAAGTSPSARVGGSAPKRCLDFDKAFTKIGVGADVIQTWR